LQGLMLDEGDDEEDGGVLSCKAAKRTKKEADDICVDSATAVVLAATAVITLGVSPRTRRMYGSSDDDVGGWMRPPPPLLDTDIEDGKRLGDGPALFVLLLAVLGPVLCSTTCVLRSALESGAVSMLPLLEAREMEAASLGLLTDATGGRQRRRGCIR
jgi:hypothetical protein